MKKTVLFGVIIGLLAVASCKKANNNTPTIPGGSWTFKSNTYQVFTCDSATGDLYAYTSVTSSKNELAVDFYNILPASSGTFTVLQGINSITEANQVTVGITDPNGNYYVSTGYGAPTVSVTVSGGKVSVAGTSIELVNLDNPADSSALTFSIHEND